MKVKGWVTFVARYQRPNLHGNGTRQQICQQPECYYPMIDVFSANHKGKKMLKSGSNVWQKQLRSLSEKQPQENKISTFIWRCKVLAWLLEMHTIMPSVGEDDRHQATNKDTNTTEEQASDKTTFQYLAQYVDGSITKRWTGDHVTAKVWNWNTLHVFSVETNRWEMSTNCVIINFLNGSAPRPHPR